MARSPLPPLDIVGPDGAPLTVRSIEPADTVDGLAQRLDVDALWTGRALEPNERLSAIDDLRIGTHLRASAPDRSEVESGDDEASGGDLEVAVVAGPAVTTWHRLGVGRHLVGRSPHAGVRIDDPSVELHHALLTIGVDGAANVTQLSGPVPIRVGTTPWEGAVDESGETLISIGASRLCLRRLSTAASSEIGTTSGGSLAPHPTDPWRRLVRRAPHAPEKWNAPSLTAPLAPPEPQRPSLTGLIGTAVTAAGAVVIATVMGNPMFMLFAAMGVVAAVTTSLAGSVTARRRRTRLRARHAEELAVFAAGIDAMRDRRAEYHRRVHRTIAETLDEATAGGTQLWQRRLEGELRGVVGTGTSRWSPPIEVADRGTLDSALLSRIEGCAKLRDAAAPISIRPADAVAFHGPLGSARSIARSIIVQFATWAGPADWQLVVISRDREAWSWSDWLPHGALDRRSLIVVDAEPGISEEQLLAVSLESIDTSRFTVVVTDVPDSYAVRTGPLRRFLSIASAASLVVVDTDATVPAICRRVLTVGAAGSASWSGELVEADETVGIAFAGVSITTADRAARALAHLVDPEDDGGAGGGVPADVSLGELLSEPSAESIAQRWCEGGADPAPAAPLGMSADGRVDIDLVRDGPHGLIAGTTGAGKSELLRSLVLGLAASVGPEHLSFVLVDYKGGSTFDACVDLPHTVGLVTDLDEGLAERALMSLDAELHRRERILRSVGASDLTAYRAQADDGSEPIARLVVVIDEFAALATDLPDFLKALVGIAQRGRSLGVHLLLATQRPAGVVNDDIRANTNLRLALRLHDKSDAVDVVGDDLPATFARGLPGRAALRLGPDELMVFQTAHCTGRAAACAATDGIVVERPTTGTSGGVAVDETVAHPDERTELDVVVGAIVEAAHDLGVGAAHRPWIDPLPFPLPLADLDDGGSSSAQAIGYIDDPAHQCRAPLTWQPADGSLALIGSVGSGVTSTLIALAAATCGAYRPDRLHLYVVDGRGDDGLRALASLAHCGGVVRLTEDERLHRLLRRVVDAIDQRMGTDALVGSGLPEIVVMIDGYGSLRASLGGIERQATLDLLQRVVNDGPAVGVALVIADEAGTAISMVSVAHRWLFHLDDPSAARGLGLKAVPVAPGRPGRLRIVGTGLEAQIAQGAPGLASLPSREDNVAGAPSSISALPERVRVGEIPSPRAIESVGTRCVQLGVAADDLEVAGIELVDGDHVLVVGGPRSGVSSALARVAAGWEAAMSSRGFPYRVVHLDRRVSVDAGVIEAVVSDTSTRCALVIDDAHRVHDPGAFAAIAGGDHPHVTIIAGGRADAVRTGYGHWTREVAKGRCGIVMASRGDPDGDILGVQIPRRPLVAARAGLAWIVDAGPLRQVQIALE
ncbi:FtsK/SpoIIIE domain-containing protein [Ilumatobacter nonamiensis]|uniref:FtsK/SpoIIIE domain-containing protein n=1 Tax=Ilumatobacter nonamiensis TaxID=467093 RepID=UPI00130E0E11|nr:FtsK/SpoIIIE domain-containing protein [Ilumatobacter nonamiensis]